MATAVCYLATGKISFRRGFAIIDRSAVPFAAGDATLLRKAIEATAEHSRHDDTLLVPGVSLAGGATIDAVVNAKLVALKGYCDFLARRKELDVIYHPAVRDAAGAA